MRRDAGSGERVRASSSCLLRREVSTCEIWVGIQSCECGGEEWDQRFGNCDHARKGVSVATVLMFNASHHVVLYHSKKKMHVTYNHSAHQHTNTTLDKRDVKKVCFGKLNFSNLHKATAYQDLQLEGSTGHR